MGQRGREILDGTKMTFKAAHNKHGKNIYTKYLSYSHTFLISISNSIKRNICEEVAGEACIIAPLQGHN